MSIVLTDRQKQLHNKYISFADDSDGHYHIKFKVGVQSFRIGGYYEYEDADSMEFIADMLVIALDKMIEEETIDKCCI